MKQRLPAIVLAALCLNFPVRAQQPGQQTSTKSTTTGKVISASNQEPLPGAIIKITNTNDQTRSNQTLVTNDRGEFTLTLPDGTYNLSLHYLSYKAKTLTIQIPLNQPLIISLDTDEQTLQEVEINAGYYTVKDRERTGSISRVGAETIGKQPVSNPLAALIGRMPGVNIQQQTGVPGGGFAVRIRGRNSITNGNDPLYIINGVPFPSSTLSSSNINALIVPAANPLSAINPSDIESIEVLKDADATAIYGSRGANGVVLITTKQGKPGVMRVDLNYNQGLGQVTRKMNLLNTEQYLEMRKEAFSNDNLNPETNDYDVNGTWDKNRYTDWQEELIGGTAGSLNANFSLSGGNTITNFLLTGGYNKENLVYPGNNRYGKKSALLSINQTPENQKFKIYSAASYSNESSHLPPQDLTYAITLAPNAPATYTPEGELNWENGTFGNPLSHLKKLYKANTGTLNANSSLSYGILSGLELSARIGYSRMQRDEIQTTPLTSANPAWGYTSVNRESLYADNWTETWTMEPQLSWTRSVKGNRLNIMAGTTVQQNILHMQTVQGSGYVSDGLLENIAAATTLRVQNSVHNIYRYLSVYGRLNYALRERYFINLTGRRDGSTRFGSENKYADFGALGLAWLFSNEGIIKDRLHLLSFGKLRLSYGTTGNDQIGDYNYLELWNPTTNPYQGGSALYPLRLQNPAYAWEVNKKFEAAIELGFFKDKLRFNTAYYRNRSSNQLVRYTIAPSTGFPNILANLPATVQNTGWEFEVSATPLRSRALHWTASFNLSIPKNKLVAFPGLETSTYSTTYELGKPLNIIKTLQSEGVDPNTGVYKFVDFDGSGSVSNPGDRKVIKILDPEYAGGVQNTITYKGFELDIFFQFVRQIGRTVNTGTAPGGFTNQPIEVLNRWRKSGDIADFQRYTITTASLPYLYGVTYGDLAIGDASYIRLKNFSLAYTIPGNKISKLGLKNARVYLQGQNVLTLTNYSGLDPETQGLVLPPLKMITAGLQISF